MEENPRTASNAYGRWRPGRAAFYTAPGRQSPLNLRAVAWPASRTGWAGARPDHSMSGTADDVSR